MSLTTCVFDSRHRQADIVSVSQLSTNDPTLVAGSTLDARTFDSLSYTMTSADDELATIVYGANSSDFSDKVSLDTNASIADGVTESYSVAPPPFAYYCVYVEATDDGNQGTLTVNGIAK